MLSVIIPKLLLKGAIKSFIVKPILSATVTIIPKTTIIKASLLGYETIVSTRDFTKYGAENIFDRLLDKQLEFEITKSQPGKFKITPINEMAILYYENSIYNILDSYDLDLNMIMDQIDQLLIQLEEGLENYEEEVDKVLASIEKDVDQNLKKLVDKPQIRDIDTKKEKKEIDELINSTKRKLNRNS